MRRVGRCGVVVTGTLLWGLAALWPAAGAGQAPKPEDLQFFETKVRPVLFEKCFGCHGEKLQKGGVRLDSRAELLKDAGTSKIVVPGDPEASALVHAIRYDGKIQMPPGGKLTDTEIAALTQWVKMGAPWPGATPASSYVIKPAQRQFWSFLPIRRSATPAVKNSAWVKNPIDAFILAKLEAKGLKPAPAADKRTLIRRATYDLTGLPPTPAEVDAFLADKSPDAFAKVVDRLLASPRYGERWGRHWLDVVRYADSADARGLGSEGDISEAWRYRDWVVDALNADMGYDKFVMNQVAGDLLPSETDPKSPLNVSGTIATGLLAIGNWGNGDADKEKIITDIADDQVDVISRGIMGLTVGCARCHDHKFDPIPTKDYYGLAGIFFSSHILPRLTPKGQGEVMLRIPLETPAQKAERDKYTALVEEKTRQLQALKEAKFAAYAQSLTPQTAAYVQAVWDYKHRQPPADTSADSLATFAKARNLSAFGIQQWLAVLQDNAYKLMTVSGKEANGFTGVYYWRGTGDCPNLTVNTNPTAQKILTFTLPPKSVSVHPGPSNGVVVQWVSPIQGMVQVTGKVTDADPAGGDGIAWAIDHQTAIGSVEIASGDFPNGGAQEFAQGKNATGLKSIPVMPGEKIQLVVLPKENYICDTTTVDLVIKQQNGSGVWDLTHDLLDQPLRSNPRADSYGHASVWSFLDMADSHRDHRIGGPAGAAFTTFVQTAATATDRAEVERAAQAFQKAFAAGAGNPFRAVGDDLSVLPPDSRTAISTAQAELDALKKAAPPPPAFANGIAEGGIPDSPQAGIHDVAVHIRGRYDRLGDMVPRHFPIILAGEKQPPITHGSGRLELARWLVSDTHPLTARVIVNRVWQHHFGEGIVRTPSNFGFLGERPTHPELLDWLASVLKAPVTPSGDRYACGWSLKKLHRLILLSNTYQQSSDGALATMKTDPDNRLFGRMNRQRLESEAIRDTLLADSGKLDTKMGGVATRDFNAPRRTLYIMTVRSDRSGYAPLFDTADPTVSVDHRVVSTVAPQALFLMNNAFVRDQTRVLAQRTLQEGGATDAARILWLYRLLYGRAPLPAEAQIGRQYLNRARQETLLPAGAAAVSDRELRAWTAYCEILVCTNELIYVD